MSEASCIKKVADCGGGEQPGCRAAPVMKALQELQDAGELPEKLIPRIVALERKYTQEETEAAVGAIERDQKFYLDVLDMFDTKGD